MMPAFPLVVDRLVAHLPTLPGWSGVQVYDGPPVTGDVPADYVTVGFVLAEDLAGSYEQSRPSGWGVQEDGVVRCEVVSQSGDVDLPERRARAFALVDAWQAWADEDPTLGVLPSGSSASLVVDVEPAQTTSGAACRLAVTVNYTATL